MAQQVVPWVLIRLDQTVLGIESSWVREMLLLPQSAAVPQAAAEVRGVITVRDRTIPVVDLRRLLGMSSLSEDADKLNALLQQRAEDHKNWLAELERSVREKRDFTLTLDPHQCAFGKWYDTFKPTSVVLDSHLKRFDLPHQQIHALGRTIAELTRAGRDDEAQTLIEQAHRGTLATLLQLFAETPKILAEMNREMVIVLRHGQCVIGITADAVESVEAIKTETVAEIQLSNGSGASGLVTHTARTAKTDKLILIMQGRQLLTRCSSVPVSEAA